MKRQTEREQLNRLTVKALDQVFIMRVQEGLSTASSKLSTEFAFPGSIDSIQQNVRESSICQAKIGWTRWHLVLHARCDGSGRLITPPPAHINLGLPHSQCFLVQI